MTVKTDGRWVGFTKYTPYVTATTLALSLIVLALSSVLAHIANGVIPNKAQVVFHNITTPTISIICFAICLLVNPKPSTHLIFSVVFLLGWIVQFSLWTNCDGIGTGDGDFIDFCAQWAILISTYSRAASSPTQYARFAFAVFTVTSQVVGVVFAGIATHRARRAEFEERKLASDVHGGST